VRLMHGKWSDPRVGRDVLFGALYGLAITLWAQLCILAPGWLGRSPSSSDALGVVWLVEHGWIAQQLEALRGPAQSVAVALHTHVEAMTVMLFGTAGFFLLWLVLRRTWVAVQVALLIFTLVLIQTPDYPLQALLASAVACALWLFILLRAGLLPLAVATTVAALLGAVPLTLDPTAWYAPGSAMVLLAVLGLGASGFVVALNGRKAFPDRPRAELDPYLEGVRPAGPPETWVQTFP